MVSGAGRRGKEPDDGRRREPKMWRGFGGRVAVTEEISSASAPAVEELLNRTANLFCDVVTERHMHMCMHMCMSIMYTAVSADRNFGSTT